MRSITRWLRGWADAGLKRENERLENLAGRLAEELAIERSRVKVQQVELDELAAVVARNIKRVEAETAAAARQIAGAENANRLSL